MLYELILIILTAMAPISELRGAIPLGFVLGLSPILIVISAIVANCLVFFPVYFALKFFYKKYLYKIKIFQKYMRSVQKKRSVIDKYGYLGLCIFVAIPLPMTGAWTGTILAWLLGMEWKKSFAAISLGVIIAGIIITALTLGAVSLF